MTALWERDTPSTTPQSVQDAFWYFAAERLRMYLRRSSGDLTPTRDPILRNYRFTNSYRACDRVSQYLIGRVQYQHDQNPDEVIFRTLLFKLFNKIETWEVVAGDSVPTVASFAPDELAKRVTEHAASGHAIYSAAYIVPPISECPRPKHLGHLRLLAQMLEDDLPGKVRASGGLEDLFWIMRRYSGIGDFLAFQFAVDLSYSAAVPFDDGGFVVAGPGAVDGVSKYMPDSARAATAEVITRCCDMQEVEFARRGIEFEGLFGRRLQLIDVQNLFCELSKYCRVAFPDVTGVAGRTRIKQRYVPAGQLPGPFFPPKWGLTLPPSSPPEERQCPRLEISDYGSASMFPELMEGAVTSEDRALPLRA